MQTTLALKVLQYFRDDNRLGVTQFTLIQIFSLVPYTSPWFDQFSNKIWIGLLPSLKPILKTIIDLWKSQIAKIFDFLFSLMAYQFDMYLKCMTLYCYARSWLRMCSSSITTMLLQAIWVLNEPAYLMPAAFEGIRNYALGQLFFFLFLEVKYASLWLLSETIFSRHQRLSCNEYVSYFTDS